MRPLALFTLRLNAFHVAFVLTKLPGVLMLPFIIPLARIAPLLLLLLFLLLLFFTLNPVAWPRV